MQPRSQGLSSSYPRERDPGNEVGVYVASGDGDILLDARENIPHPRDKKSGKTWCENHELTTMQTQISFLR